MVWIVRVPNMYFQLMLLHTGPNGDSASFECNQGVPGYWQLEWSCSNVCNWQEVVYVCLCVCVRLCVLCMCVSTCMCACVYICACTCMCFANVQLFGCVCTLYMCMLCTCVYMYLYVCSHLCIMFTPVHTVAQCMRMYVYCVMYMDRVYFVYTFVGTVCTCWGVLHNLSHVCWWRDRKWCSIYKKLCIVLYPCSCISSHAHIKPQRCNQCQPKRWLVVT